MPVEKFVRFTKFMCRINDSITDYVNFINIFGTLNFKQYYLLEEINHKNRQFWLFYQKSLASLDTAKLYSILQKLL